MIELKSEIGNYIQAGEKRYSFFAGNNYLGLANDPEIKLAAKNSIDQYGLNFSASRHTTGTSDIHLQLERELSGFKDEEDAVVFASGYMGNAILLQILKDQYATVLMDEASHPSIRDGIPRNIQAVQFFKHRDIQHLEELLMKKRNQNPLIITEGIFALTGEISPLDEMYAFSAKYNAILIVDDAHATGVLGASGQGTPEYFNLQHANNLYQTETMSKALGVYGGFISGSKGLTNRIRERSNIYLGSTALPPPLVAAACKSVCMVRQHPSLRLDLSAKAQEIRKGLHHLGYQTNQAPTPIIPVFFKSLDKAKHLSRYLEENGIVAPCISYPVKMDQFIIRITASVNHTQEQIDELLEILKKYDLQHGAS